MPLTRYLAEAKRCSEIIAGVLTQRGLQPVIQSIVLTEDNQLVWLIIFLNVPALNGRLEGYCSPELIHHLQTALHGKLVFLSNSTGLRYLVLLSKLPTLPVDLLYPGDVERGIFPLGEGFYGPILPRRLRNVLVAGEPGSGKSNFELILAHTALQNGFLVYLADPDAHTFNPDAWNSVAAAPVAEGPDDLVGVLEMVDAEIDRRKALFSTVSDGGLPPADLEAYNRLALQPLHPIMLIVDEANSYFDHKNILSRLEDLSRRGRKWGVVIVLAAHNWRAKDVSRGLSAMFPTRVCFRVADDTSGAVALNSRRWGKQAMRLRQPGRGILLLDGRYQVFQAYRLSPEQERQGLAIKVDLSPLSELERSLVAYALDQMDGRFVVNKLAAAFAGQGVTSHQVKILSQNWERRGWLTSPQHATDARRVTPELRSLAGFSRTSAQEAQVHTGGCEVAQAVRTISECA
ncbi:MAG TPA: FtsK/SpoIIIE domain-containing protein [Anaerolineaceae bacterium]|nr:FtsK/SpoIIIE domain-containing protein [Anaerolineaceae bacterium]